MKLKIKNAATDKNFAIPVSLLTIAPKHKNEPINKRQKPKLMRISKYSGKIFERPNKRTPIIANTTDQILKCFISHSPFTYYTNPTYQTIKPHPMYSAIWPVRTSASTAESKFLKILKKLSI